MSACDLSPGMVAEARRKLPDRRRVGVADMRALEAARSASTSSPASTTASTTCSGRSDLRAGLGGLARSLRPGGLLVFDVNTLGTLRAAYSGVHEYETGDWRFRWTGHSSRSAPSGCVAAGTLTIEARRRAGRRWGWRRASRALHRQAHHDRQRLDDALPPPGWRCSPSSASSRASCSRPSPPRTLHTKALVFARRRRRRIPAAAPDCHRGGAPHAHPSVTLPGSAVADVRAAILGRPAPTYPGAGSPPGTDRRGPPRAGGSR